MELPTKEALAEAFHAKIGEWLTKAERERVDWRNHKNAEDSRLQGVCATHDFCDANMAMLEAWQKVTGVEDELWEMDDAQTERWNEAWGLAKANGFSEEWTGLPAPR